MKNLVRFSAIILVAALLFATPVSAESATPYANSYITSTHSTVYRVSGNSLGIRFEVFANGTMLQLGVNSIKMQVSPNGTSNWTTMKTFTPDNYSQMMTTGSAHYVNTVPYTSTYRYYYRACIEYYARNSSGSSTVTDYSNVFYVSVV